MQLHTLNNFELRVLCKQLKIKHYSCKKKQELIDILENEFRIQQSIIDDNNGLIFIISIVMWYFYIICYYYCLSIYISFKTNNNIYI